MIDLALHEGVMPLVWRYLDSNPQCPVPEPFNRELRFHYHGNALRNETLWKEMLRITGLLEHHGVPIIAFKGPVLAASAYGGLAMRQFSDLDVLVERSCMPAAAELLAGQGFVPERAAIEVVGDEFFQAAEILFVKPGSATAIDVHWGMMPRYFPFVPDADAMRRRVVRLAWEAGEAPILSPHDQMLMLCAHGTKHGWPTLGSVADIAAALRTGIDWPALLDEATAVGAHRMLLLAIALAHELLGARAPGFVLDAANGDRAVSAMVPRLIRSLFVGNSEARLPFFNDWMVPLLTIGSSRARLRYVIDRVFAPTYDDWQFLRLRRPLFPLYYLLRPVRLAIEQTPRLASAAGLRRTGPAAGPAQGPAQ